MNDLKTLGERLKYVIKQSPFTLKQIAEDAGLSTQAIHQAIKKNAMTEENIGHIATITDTSAEWIMTGITSKVAGIDPAELVKSMKVVEKAAKEIGYDLTQERITHAALVILAEGSKSHT